MNSNSLVQTSIEQPIGQSHGLVDGGTMFLVNSVLAVCDFLTAE